MRLWAWLNSVARDSQATLMLTGNFLVSQQAGSSRWRCGQWNRPVGFSTIRWRHQNAAHLHMQPTAAILHGAALLLGPRGPLNCLREDSQRGWRCSKLISDPEVVQKKQQGRRRRRWRRDKGSARLPDTDWTHWQCLMAQRRFLLRREGADRGIINTRAASDIDSSSFPVSLGVKGINSFKGWGFFLH